MLTNKQKRQKKEVVTIQSEKVYITPKDLASRWCCARASVDRIAAQAGLTKLYLGNGKNGIVRYIFKEVEQYENKRKV